MYLYICLDSVFCQESKSGSEFFSGGRSYSSLACAAHQLQKKLRVLNAS